MTQTQVETEKLNRLITYGLQNGKSKDQILKASLNSGISPQTAASALKTLEETGISFPTPQTSSGQAAAISLTPAERQKVESENFDRENLIKNASEYKSLVDQYGFESTLTNPQIAGKMSGLRSNLLADVKKAETLGTLDKGLLDFADKLLGSDPTGPFAPFRNIGGTNSKVVSAKIDELISNSQNKIQSNNQILGKQTDPTQLQSGSVEKGGGLVDKIAEVSGIKGLGKGIGTTLFLNTQEGKQLQLKAESGDQNALATLNEILNDAPSTGETVGSAVATATMPLVGLKGGAIALNTATKTRLTQPKVLGRIGEAIKPVAEKISDKITPIETGVENVLRGAKPEKLEKYLQNAKEAASDFSKPTPLESAGEEAVRALTEMKSIASKAGKVKSDIVSKIGTQTVGNIATQAQAELRKKSQEILGTMITKSGSKNATGRVSSVSDKSDALLLKDVDKKLASLGKNPTFRQVDDTVDYIQDLLYKRSSNTAIPVNSKVQSVVKNTVSKLNKNLQEIGGEEYKAVNAQYGSIARVSEKLNKLLGKEGDRGGALMKRVFSPSDAGTKKLFSKVKDITGIDLVEESTLAKFAMENAGDARQANLLEEVIKGAPQDAKSFVAMAAEKLVNKLQDPVGKARRIMRGGTK